MSGGRLDDDTLRATGKTQVTLTWQHLNAAALFSRQVGALEVVHHGKEYAQFYEEIFANATGCIMCAVAGLEAFANHVFADRLRHFPNLSPALLDDLWTSSIERMSILDKLSLAMLMKNVTPFDRGAPSYQDAALLIRLRNGLVHFKPEWSDELKEHLALSARLDRLVASPFLQSEPGVFPRAWATHANTRWAVHASVALIDEFTTRMGLPNTTLVQQLKAFQA